MRSVIGGKLDRGSARFDMLNPATEQVIGSAPDATQGDLDRAIDAARRSRASGLGRAGRSARIYERADDRTPEGRNPSQSLSQLNGSH